MDPNTRLQEAQTFPPEPIGLNNLYFHPPVAPAEPPHQPVNELTRLSRNSKGIKALHPLIWFSLTLSLLALVLSVPKGALPTLTGRHESLRAREKAVENQQRLLTHLAGFLPEPLATFVAGPFGSHVYSQAPANWPLLLPSFLPTGDTWQIETIEQGVGSRVIHIKGQGKDAWIIHTVDATATGPALLLSHALSKQAQTATLREPCPDADADAERQFLHRDEERKRRELDDDRRREREIIRSREVEVEEREVEVGRRERWVVDEIRKLSDRAHTQASELTLEDRITERLKAYQRQLRHGDAVEL